MLSSRYGRARSYWQLGASIFALLSAGVSAALAQGTPDATNVESVVVTSTRVDRQGYTAPTPTTVIGSDLIDAMASPNLADVVNELPALADSVTPNNINGLASLAPTNAGMNLLNLRGLGANRTLVLLDGARTAPSNATLNVDINMLPSELVQRVDVVTGGASADWGSDAVAGVVNFILNKNFVGFKANIQGGETEYGDGQNFQTALTYGTAFDGDRGHFEISGKYNYVSNIPGPSFSGRHWYQGYKVLANPNGSATDVVLPNVGLSAATDGGLITGGPLKGVQFAGPTGTPAPFNFGFVSGNESVGGTAEDDGGYLELQPATHEGNVFARASYDIFDNVTAYVETQYAESAVTSLATPFNRFGNLTIQSGNAFIPAAVQSQLTAQKISSFAFGKVNRELGSVSYTNDAETGNIKGGLSGSFGDGWNWDAYYQHGWNNSRILGNNLVNTTNYNLAIAGAVSPTTGAIVCQSTLTSPTNGCIPLNPFGAAPASAAAQNYVTGTGWETNAITQDDAVLNVRGNPFSTWAGVVSVAAGFEYRYDHLTENTDSLSQTGVWSNPFGTPSAGGYSVAEGYVETVVPLLSDMPLVKELDFNGAARVAGYSLAGTVIPWKLGLTYEVTDDLRLRGIRSTDIRAPNLQDLFATGIVTHTALNDPVTKTSPQPAQVTTGSTNLTPEVANTTSGGFVYQPHQIPGLSMSVDYFGIKIGNAIVTPPAQTIINQCVAGNSQACLSITRDPSTNAITQLNIAPLNIQSETTSGFDFSANYHIDLADVVSSWVGDLSLSALMTDTMDHTINLLGSSVQYAGTNGDGTFADPRWRGTFGQTYTLGGLSVALFEQYISGGVVSNKTPLIINNSVPAIAYLDLSTSYSFANGLQVFGVVDNLLDRNPPASPYVTTAPQLSLGVNDSVYDTFGRRVRIGVRYQM